ncbi:MAG TPA: hypothetical protein VND41_03240 [Nitrososphaerales archaeon]|nr:hypothetical protein [Nitrososphaerales archaeon]
MALMSEADANKLGVILNSCSKESARALSKLISKPVRSRLPGVMEAWVPSLEEATEDIADQEVCAVYLSGEGDVRIGAMLSTPIGEAGELAALLMGKKGKVGLSALAKSSITEAGNIMMGSFLNGLRKATGLRVRASAASMGIDTLGTLLELPVLDIASRTGTVLLARVRLRVPKTGPSANLFIILDHQGAREILARINADS